MAIVKCHYGDNPRSHKCLKVWVFEDSFTVKKVFFPTYSHCLSGWSVKYSVNYVAHSGTHCGKPHIFALQNEKVSTCCAKAQPSVKTGGRTSVQLSSYNNKTIIAFFINHSNFLFLWLSISF